MFDICASFYAVLRDGILATTLYLIKITLGTKLNGGTALDCPKVDIFEKIML